MMLSSLMSVPVSKFEIHSTPHAVVRSIIAATTHDISPQGILVACDLDEQAACTWNSVVTKIESAATSWHALKATRTSRRHRPYHCRLVPSGLGPGAYLCHV